MPKTWGNISAGDCCWRYWSWTGHGPGGYGLTGSWRTKAPEWRTYVMPKVVQYQHFPGRRMQSGQDRYYALWDFCLPPGATTQLTTAVTNNSSRAFCKLNVVVLWNKTPQPLNQRPHATTQIQGRNIRILWLCYCRHCHIERGDFVASDFT